ncbi:hemoglobin subunit beta-3-like [Mixophyes fleayi]|uniref:hemoglobin subunit beta-3-like n=1 Tax=Mixophyes fleayi TaxID=3061075 RepID=UPI003F4D9262
MVRWTAQEKAAIVSVWQKVDVHKEGPEALVRLLIIYPWTQRDFDSFGNLSSARAIARNAKLHNHGIKVLSAIGDTISHLDNMKGFLHQLSDLHAFKLHVDPVNFKLFAKVLVIVLAGKLGKAFTPQVQQAWEKFFAVLVDAFLHSYHFL